jgi:F0F1-type ATP synthase membrane subunit b/b'
MTKELQRELTPEERFAELVAVREKEKEIKRRLAEARARAEEMLAQARERAVHLKAQAAQELQRQIERRRAEAHAASEAEARKIIAESHATAHRLGEHLKARHAKLFEKLRQELLFEERPCSAA